MTETAQFLGTTPRSYPQYLDPVPDGTTLVAQPLSTYQIAVADAWQLGVPPGDGLWGATASYPLTGFNATPGLAVTGLASPGYPGAGAEPEDSAPLGAGLGGALDVTLPVSATFIGTSPRSYTQYLDVNSTAPGTTLVAQPLATYEIAIADAWDVGTIPGDGLWENPVPEIGPGFNAIPGWAVAGQSSPGYSGAGTGPDDLAVLDGASLGTALDPAVTVQGIFTGTAERTYPQFVSESGNWTTLVAQPGFAYTLTLADQWQNIGPLPGDGNWVYTTFYDVTFGAIPGLSVIGGASPGFPGLTTDGGGFLATLRPHPDAAKALDAALEPGPPAVPERGPRVVTGRRRVLPPPRKRRPPRRRRVLEGASRGH